MINMVNLDISWAEAYKPVQRFNKLYIAAYFVSVNIDFIITKYLKIMLYNLGKCKIIVVGKGQK